MALNMQSQSLAVQKPFQKILWDLLLLTVPSAFNEAPLKYRKPMSRFYTMGLKVNEKVL